MTDQLLKWSINPFVRRLIYQVMAYRLWIKFVLTNFECKTWSNPHRSYWYLIKCLFDIPIYYLWTALEWLGEDTLKAGLECSQLDLELKSEAFWGFNLKATLGF